MLLGREFKYPIDYSSTNLSQSQAAYEGIDVDSGIIAS